MAESRDVVFWSIRRRQGRRKPYELRWRVAERPFSRSFTTRGLADAERSKLMGAARKGEAFSTLTGEPVAWERTEKTVYDCAVSLARRDWNGAAGSTRSNVAGQLVCVVLATLDPGKGSGVRPDDRTVRRALRSWAFCVRPDDAVVPDDVADALAWVAACSRPVSAIGDQEAARAVLEAPEMARRLDGRPVAVSTAAERRVILYRLLAHAVDLRALDANPLAGMRKRRAESATREISPARLCSPRAALALLAWLREHLPHLWAFFGTLLYLGARPGELRTLKRTACHLPATGWGSVTLGASAPEVHPWFSDASMDGVEVRGLKARASGAVRVVPVPPAGVAMLREHLKLLGTAADGRLFRGPDGESMLMARTYLAGWNKARRAVLSPADYAAGVMARAYDLRHLCASLSLSWGVPAGEVARRLGHSVKTLMGIYAHWVTGFEATSNHLIDNGWNAVTRQNTNPGPATGQTPGQLAA